MHRVNIHTKSDDSRSRQHVKGYGSYTVRDIVKAREIRRSDGLELSDVHEYGFIQTRFGGRVLVSNVGGDHWWSSIALMSTVVDLIIEKPTTAEQVETQRSAEVAARKQATIDGLQPTLAEYRERRVHPIFKYERLVDGTTAVHVELPGSALMGVFLCEISRGWSRLGGTGWQFIHPANGIRSHKNRHDAAFDCFRRLLRN
jgi:hypothetical protein